MSWSHWVLLGALCVGFVGFALMAASFWMIARGGGWIPVMLPDAHGRWPLPRWLLLIGAVLGLVFSATVVALAAIPGAWPF